MHGTKVAYGKAVGYCWIRAVKRGRNSFCQSIMFERTVLPSAMIDSKQIHEVTKSKIINYKGERLAQQMSNDLWIQGYIT